MSTMAKETQIQDIADVPRDPARRMIDLEAHGEKAQVETTVIKAEERSAPYSVVSNAMRIYLTYFLGVAMILSTLTATIYFPLIPLLSTQFHTSIQAINLTVTIYAVAQALAPALFASLADSYGRRPVLLVLVAIYAAASLGLALNTDSYPALLLLRAVQSMGGSPLTAIAYGVVADVAPVAERGRMLGPMLSTCNGISAAGPVIGGALALGTGGVRWVFVALLLVATLCLGLAGFTLPETAHCIVGNGSLPPRGIWRTWWSLLRSEKGRKNSHSGQPERSQEHARAPWSLGKAFGSFRIIFHKDAAAVLWTVASSYSVYYTFQVAIPVIFDEIYNYNEFQIGLVFLPGLAGMTIGGIIAGKLVDRNYTITAEKHNISCTDGGKHDLREFPIELARYRNCLVFVILETALVVGYGWGVSFRVHASVPIILQFFICGCSTLLSHTASALLVDIFPDRSSSAYASGQIMRCGLSAAFAAVLQPLVDAVGRGWFFTMFALLIGLSSGASVALSRWKGMRWRQLRAAGREELVHR